MPHALTLVLMLTLTSPAPTPVASASAPGIPDSARSEPFGAADSLAPPRSAAAGTDPGTGPVDYMWVLRGSLVDRASIDSVVVRARRMGVRGLLVQVVGRGDAYYASRLLPRAESLPTRAGADFDPLGELVEQAHDAGLEVHAWMNCFLVWSAPRPPRDPRHVVRAHPEWIARLGDGRRMSQLTARARERLGVEGVFLSPSHPAVRDWLAGIAAEIVGRYPVDGIHLDYIRQPDAAIGLDPTTRARFALESGVDPARFHRLPAAARGPVEASWKAFQREQVTATVRQVRDSIEAVRPGVMLSAAVIADTVRAERDNAQSWRAWLRDGVLDRVFLMCYASRVQMVMDQLTVFREQVPPDRMVPGIAVFNASPGSAAVKIKGARELGYPRIALYSYDSLFSQRGRWGELSDRLDSHLEPGLPRRND